MEELRKIISNILRESLFNEEVIEETQTGQKDLEKFANDILKLVAEQTMKEKLGVVRVYDNDMEPITKIPPVNTLMMNGEEFLEIENFVNSTNIKIVPTIKLIDNSASTRGQMIYSRRNQFNEEYYEILLKYYSEDLEEINKIFNKDGREVTTTDIYFKLFYMFFSTLLHELQHAYDAWRSKGKAFDGQLKKSYTSAQEKANMLKKTKSGYDEMTPEEIEAINKSRIAYLNLVHEINARYAQAMHKIILTGIDFKTFDDVKQDWNKVYSDFKINFDGWRHLSDKMKKKLTRRLAKAYQEAIENLKTGAEKYSKEELKMVSEDFGSKKLDYKIEHMGAHHGQEDLELGLYIHDEIIGMVQYTLYHGELTVRDIVVRPEFRRKGYGSKMMKYIKNQHPDYKYVPSMMTDLGAKFIHKDVDLDEIRKIVRDTLGESFLWEKDEQDSNSLIAYHGSRSVIPFKNFDNSMIGTGLVSSGNRSYDGFFFTTEKENAEFYTEYFLAKVKVKNVELNPVDLKHPSKVLSIAKNDKKNYIIEDVLDGSTFSDIIVVPSNNIESIDILEWEFVGDEDGLFERYDEIFGFDDEDGVFVNQDMIDEVLLTIGNELDFLLKIPVFKKYYDSKSYFINENIEDNDWVNYCNLPSDNIRYYYIKKAIGDNPTNEEPNHKRLVDTWDGYDDLVFVANRGNFVDYYEGFVESCWRAIYDKQEYDGLTKPQIIEKLVSDRISKIAKDLDLKIVEFSFKKSILFIRFKK